MRTSEPVAISSIFARKTKDGRYTNSASLYQNILRYSLELKQKQSKNNSLSFTSWEITDWLTTNNSCNADEHTKYRIENPLKTVKIKLDNLIQLQLLDIAGYRPMSKRPRMTPIYQFNGYSYLIALIIQSFDSKTSLEIVSNKIYDLLCNIFTDDPSSTSTSKFISRFLKTCKDREVFEYIVILLKETLAMADESIVEMADLFKHLYLLDFKDIKLRTIFHNLFDDTINELDLETRKLVLYNLKLDIERKMRELATDFKEFEKMRFQLRGFADMIVLEGHCTSCDHYVAIGVELLDYRKRTINSDLGIITGKCPHCGVDNSLHIAAVL